MIHPVPVPRIASPVPLHDAIFQGHVEQVGMGQAARDQTRLEFGELLERCVAEGEARSFVKKNFLNSSVVYMHHVGLHAYLV